MLKRTAKPYYGKSVRRVEQVADQAARNGNMVAANAIRANLAKHIHARRERKAFRRGRGFLSNL